MLSTKNIHEFDAAAVHGSSVGKNWRAAAHPKGINHYLRTLLMPFNVREVGIPDLDMTPSVMKGLDYTHTLTVAQPDAVFLIAFFPGNMSDQILVFVSVAGNPFTFLTAIDPDENLGESFRAARPVSGGVSVKSNTVSGSAFNVAGLVNAVGVSTLAPIPSLTFANILAGKKDNGSLVRNVGVADGVVVLMCPNGENPFMVPENPNILPYSTSTVTFDNQPQTGTGGWATGNHVLVASTNFSIYDSDTSSVVLFPPGTLGKSRVRSSFCIKIVAGAGAFIIAFIRVTYQIADPVTYLPVTQNSDLAFTVQSLQPGGEIQYFLDTLLFDYPNIQRIQVFVQADVGITTTTNTFARRIEVETYENYLASAKQPAFLVAVSKMGVGQSLDISGVMNYEAIPDVLLTKNQVVKVEVEDPMDMAMAEALFTTLGNGTFACVYPNSQYQELFTNGYLESLCTGEAVWNAAPRIRDRLNAAWGMLDPQAQRRIKKLARMGLEGGASALGGYLGGPSGAITGQGFGEYLGRSFLSAPRIKYNAASAKGKEEEEFDDEGEMQRRYPQMERSVALGLPAFKCASAAEDDLAELEWMLDPANPHWEGFSKTARSASLKLANEKKLKIQLNSRVGLLSGQNKPRTMHDRSVANCVIVGGNDMAVSLAMIVEGYPVSEIPVLESRNMYTPNWIPIDIAPDTLLRVEESLMTQESKAFFENLPEFLRRTRTLGRGTFYLRPGGAGSLSGDSHQLAMLAALVGADGMANYTGGIEFTDTAIKVKPVGMLIQKLVHSLTERKPLIFPYDDTTTIETENYLLQIKDIYPDLDIAVITPWSLASGIRTTSPDTLVIGAGVNDILQAWVAQNQMSIGSKETIVKTTQNINPSAPSQNPYRREGMKREEVEALIEKTISTIESLKEQGSVNPAFDPQLRKLKNWMELKLASREAGAADLGTKLSAFQKTLEQEAAHLAPKAPKKKGKPKQKLAQTRIAQWRQNVEQGKYSKG